jgi:hypothetical protein
MTPSASGATCGILRSRDQTGTNEGR